MSEQGPERLALVTGATGFAGSHALDALLAGGWRVRIPVRPTSSLRWIPPAGVETVTADLRDDASLARLVAGVRWVFHFGGVTRSPRPEGFFEVNTDGTIRLYKAIKAAGGVELFLFCSSLAASGPAPNGEQPRREGDLPAPITSYGRSKLDAETWLNANRAQGTRLLIVRPPAIYGPRDTGIFTFFKWVRSGIVPLLSTRDSRLSIVEARDLAGACRFLAESGADGTFHVSDGEFYAWEQLGEIAARAMGRSAWQWRVPGTLVKLVGSAGGLLGRLTGAVPVINPDKARDLIQPFWICATDKLRAAGYTSQMPLERGFAETIAWYRREGWL
jgi:dihydroflavonol-4-reductase